ncbi:transposase [Bradyrhizobium sp. CIR18]|nr:transposase [Bradyrhizobium sp. CIR18]
MLSANAVKPAREQLTLIRIFEELRGRGYDGGYDALRRYARQWGKERGQSTAAAYVPLSFAPGEAYQFDWSHEVVLLSGTTVMVKVAHVRLCHSRMLFVRAYPRETQEMVFDAYDRAFALFRGTCSRGIYDNMKTAVETIFVGKDRRYNRRFLQMCSHYLVDPVACTPASGWEKGQVENQVGLVRERFSTPRRATQARSLCRPLRRLPCSDGVGRSLALCTGTGSQAWRLAQWCSLQGLGVANSDRADPAPACQHRDGNRQMVDILNAVLTDGLPAVEVACAEALGHGVHSADVVLNILARQREPAPPANIMTPAALTLRHAPIADCARYDNLRRTI